MTPVEPATTTTVVRLPRLLEELKKHVPAERAPKIDELIAQASGELTHELQASIKAGMRSLASKSELNAAVGALMAVGAAAAPAPEVATETVAPSDLPPLEELLGSLTHPTAIVHAFHCREPSCTVEGCRPMAAKLARLREHVSSCRTPAGCALCRMWSVLECCRDTSHLRFGGGAPLVGAASGQPAQWHAGTAVPGPAGQSGLPHAFAEAAGPSAAPTAKRAGDVSPGAPAKRTRRRAAAAAKGGPPAEATPSATAYAELLGAQGALHPPGGGAPVGYPVPTALAPVDAAMAAVLRQKPPPPGRVEPPVAARGGAKKGRGKRAAA